MNIIMHRTAIQSLFLRTASYGLLVEPTLEGLHDPQLYKAPVQPKSVAHVSCELVGYVSCGLVGYVSCGLALPAHQQDIDGRFCEKHSRIHTT